MPEIEFDSPDDRDKAFASLINQMAEKFGYADDDLALVLLSGGVFMLCRSGKTLEQIAEVLDDLARTMEETHGPALSDLDAQMSKIMGKV